MIAKEDSMKISIEYCSKWNYKPRASSLGEELENKFGAEVELLSSDGGVFEIVVDGSLLFSKRSLNRFPEEGEIPHLLEASRSWGLREGSVWLG